MTVLKDLLALYLRTHNIVRTNDKDDATIINNIYKYLIKLLIKIKPTQRMI